MTPLQIGTFVAVLLFLVVIHELGHFITAKMAGVKVHEFGVGFPPKLFGFRRGETEYTLNLLPIGGFVRMEGEEDPSAPRSLASASIPWRLVILSAGVVVNFIAAVVLFAVSGALPKLERLDTVFINSVATGSPAEAAGIRPDDVISGMNGRQIRTFTDVSFNVNLTLGGQTDVTLVRGGKSETIYLTPRIAPPPGQGAMGVTVGIANPVWKARTERGISVQDLAARASIPEAMAASFNSFGVPPTVAGEQLEKQVADRYQISVEDYRAAVGRVGATLGLADAALVQDLGRLEQTSRTPAESVSAGLQRSGDMLVAFKNEIIGMVARRTAPEVAGPVGIAQITGRVVERAQEVGIGPILDFTAVLSLNLAILNALPIPMLDGGRILFVLIEALRGGRRIAPEKEKYAHLAGALVLFALILVVTGNDLLRLATQQGWIR